MKRQMLIYFFISMLVDREKEWDNYKMEVVIKKVNKKKIVIFQIIFEMVHGQPYEGFQKKKTPYTSSHDLSLEFGMLVPLNDL